MTPSVVQNSPLPAPQLSSPSHGDRGNRAGSQEAEPDFQPGGKAPVSGVIQEPIWPYICMHKQDTCCST